MTGDQQPFDYHFATLAGDYKDVRFTDPEPIAYIKRNLAFLPTIDAIELGCGTGRYTAALIDELGDRLTVQCVDASADMLAELDQHLEGDHEGQYAVINGTAEEVRFGHGVCDAVFSFNALHHFDLPHVLRNIAAWLRPGGLAFLYTRTPSQNERNLWGQYFPGFVEKEDRLKNEATLRAAVDAAPNLRYVETKRFAYSRQVGLSTVLDKVDHFHYSTFRLYGRNEFEAAREAFVERLMDAYPDSDNISWTDYNLMLVVEKHEEEERDG